MNTPRLWPEEDTDQSWLDEAPIVPWPEDEDIEWPEEEDYVD